MKRAHRTRRFGAHLRHARVVCLDIPDDYGFMDAELVRLLEARGVGAVGEIKSARLNLLATNKSKLAPGTREPRSR